MMILRHIIVEMFSASRGKPLSMTHVMQHAKIHGYAGSSVYKELDKMVAAGQIAKSGTKSTRYWHQTPKTIDGMSINKPGPQAKPKVKNPKAATKKRDAIWSSKDDYPLIQKLVPYGKWKIPAEMAHVTRSIFDLGGRA